jgi:hypothetical protein
MECCIEGEALSNLTQSPSPMFSMGKEDNKSKIIIFEGQITKLIQTSHG